MSCPLVSSNANLAPTSSARLILPPPFGMHKSFECLIILVSHSPSFLCFQKERVRRKRRLGAFDEHAKKNTTSREGNGAFLYRLQRKWASKNILRASGAFMVNHRFRDFNSLRSYRQAPAFLNTERARGVCVYCACSSYLIPPPFS